VGVAHKLHSPKKIVTIYLDDDGINPNKLSDHLEMLSKSYYGIQKKIFNGIFYQVTN